MPWAPSLSSPAYGIETSPSFWRNCPLLSWMPWSQSVAHLPALQQSFPRPRARLRCGRLWRLPPLRTLTELSQGGKTPFPGMFSTEALWWKSWGVTLYLSSCGSSSRRMKSTCGKSSRQSSVWFQSFRLQSYFSKTYLHCHFWEAAENLQYYSDSA